MDVARSQFARGAGIAIGHRHDDRFLETQYIGEVRMIIERVHDGELGSTGVAKDMCNSLIF